MSQNRQGNVDFSRFESKQECNGKESDVNKCECIDRIIYALKYYTFLTTKINTEGQETFINFVQTLYQHYLNDIIHLTIAHEQHLQDINKVLFTKYNFTKCDIKSCILTDRYCR
eukprot:150326_1